MPCPVFGVHYTFAQDPASLVVFALLPESFPRIQYSERSDATQELGRSTAFLS